MTTVEEMTRDQLKAHIQEHSLDVPTNIGTEEMRYNVIKLRDAQTVVATVPGAPPDDKADQAPASDQGAPGAPPSDGAPEHPGDAGEGASVAPSASNAPTEPPPPPPPVAPAAAPTAKHEKPKATKPSKKANESKADDKASEEAPGAVYYRVERYSRWVSDGVVHQLRADSFVNSLSHPIDELRSQGVPLVEVSAPDDDPGVGHRFA